MTGKQVKSRTLFKYCPAAWEQIFHNYLILHRIKQSRLIKCSFSHIGGSKRGIVFHLEGSGEPKRVQDLSRFYVILRKEK